jgi:hypothetical protein
MLAGELCTMVAMRYLRVLTYDRGANPAVLTGFAAVFLFVVACVASWLPAHRAAGVDPLRGIGQR